MLNSKLEELHLEMLAREISVQEKRSAIKKLEEEIANGQEQYVYLRDQYVSTVKNILTARGINSLSLQKSCNESRNVSSFEKELNVVSTALEISQLLDEYLPLANEYERLNMIHSVMTKGGKHTETIHTLLLSAYRQEVASIRILLNS